MTVFSIEVVPKDPLWKIDLLTYIIEKLGFSGIWLSEHPHNRSSFITSSHLLKRTSRIWIGLGVINPYTINPFVIAQLTASLTELAPNRVKIAIGAGDKTTLESIGIERIKPLEKIRETITIIRALLTEKQVTIGQAHGRLDFNPRSRVSIYVGAQGPRMLQQGGEIGDGVLVNYSDLEDLKWAYGEVKKGAERVNRSMEDIDVAAYLTISIDEDLEKAIKTATPYTAYILCGLPSNILEGLNIREEEIACIREVIRKADWLKLYSLISPEIVKKLAIICRPEKLKETIEDIIKIGYNQIVFGAPLGPRILQSLKKIREVVNEIHRVC